MTYHVVKQISSVINKVDSSLQDASLPIQQHLDNSFEIQVREESISHVIQCDVSQLKKQGLIYEQFSRTISLGTA